MVEVTFLGTGNAFCPTGRLHSLVLIDGTMLVDAPPTVIPQLRKHGISPSQITDLFITHWHGDHTFGLPFLLLERKWISDRQAENKLRIHAHTGGEERFRAIITSYFKDTSATIIMFDLTNKNSFDKIPYWISQADDYNTCGKRHPIFLFGNKKDLVRNYSYIDKELIDECLDTYNIDYYEEISSINYSFDIIEFVNTLTDIIISKLNHDCKGIYPHQNVIQLNNQIVTPSPSSQKNKKCCTIM